jgi:hypothetical protein
VPFRDTNPDCKPDARYKAIGRTGGVGLYALKSADSVNWKLAGRPVRLRFVMRDADIYAFQFVKLETP